MTTTWAQKVLEGVPRFYPQTTMVAGEPSRPAIWEADALAAIPAADARAEALKEAAAVADAFADQSIVDAALWRKEGMPKTAVISEEHAKAARLVAAAILRALDDQREGGRDG